MRGLKDKVAVVTGAAGGIGQAICRRLVEEGCAVGAFDKDAAKLAGFCKTLQAGGARVHAGAVDITDHAAVAAAVQATEAALGPIDILINNAGWDRLRNFIDTDPAFWDTIIGINLKGPLNMHHAVLPGMARRRSGKVVTIASDAGRVGSSGEAVYAACKGGMISFTKTVARELARSGVRLNAVCPGPTETPLFESFIGEGEAGKKVHDALQRSIPLKRLGRPEDIPGIVAFLSSDDADFITGQVISVSGGLTMAG